MNNIPLATIIRRILAESGQPLRLKEITNRARSTGYVSTSKDFLKSVSTTLGKMRRKHIIVHVADGYRLRKK
jgi:chromosome segregation and condensation protein ScpB